MQKLLQAGLALAVLVASSPATGFGLRTHLYIAEQVLIDLERHNCHIVTAGERVEVPREVCDAVLHYPGAFRAGAIGPDAFPDLVVGQTYVHPGTENGRQAADWFDHLLAHARTEQEIAFAYGEMVHAAGDVFAHSYVNNYAGGVFEITKWRHKDIERRHFQLEKYIDQRLPFTPKLSSLEVPADLLIRAMVQTHYLPLDKELTPELFYEAFLDPTGTLSKEISSRLAKAGPAAHMTAMWTMLAVANRSARTATCNEIEAVQTMAASWRRYADAEAAARRGEKRTVPRIEIPKYVSLAGVDCPQSALDAADAAFNRTVEESQSIPWNDTALNERDTWWKELPSGIRRPLARAYRQYERAAETRDRMRAVRIIAPLWREDVTAAIRAYMQASLESAKAMVASSDEVPPPPHARASMIGPYKRWRRCYFPVFLGTPAAAAEIDCNRARLLGDAMSPERATAYAGIGDVPRGIIFTYLGFQHWLDGIVYDALVGAAGLASPSLGGLIDDIHNPVRIGRDKLNKTFLKPRNGQLAFLCVADLIDTDLGILARRGGEQVQADVPCVARPEGGERHFVPNKFVAVRHAVTLAKLSLLDKVGVEKLANSLAERGGVQVSVVMGEGRSIDGGPSRYSVIIDTVRSLDGSGQWQGESLPFPKSERIPPDVKLESSGYPYPGVRVSADKTTFARPGFPFYRTDELRKHVFSQLFPDPFEGEVLRRPEYGPDHYPFKPCSNDPFRKHHQGAGIKAVCRVGQ